jgi:hypothetical protein
MDDKDYPMGRLELFLSWIFRGLAVVAVAKSTITAFAGGFSDALFWLSISLLLLGASYDAINIFRVAILGQVDYSDGRRALSVYSKFIFGLAALVLLLAWLVRHWAGSSSH